MHTSAYVRQHTSAYGGVRQHTSAYVSIRPHTSAYVRIRPHTPHPPATSCPRAPAAAPGDAVAAGATAEWRQLRPCPCSRRFGDVAGGQKAKPSAHSRCMPTRAGMSFIGEWDSYGRPPVTPPLLAIQSRPSTWSRRRCACVCSTCAKSSSCCFNFFAKSLSANTVTSYRRILRHHNSVKADLTEITWVTAKMVKDYEQEWCQ